MTSGLTYGANTRALAAALALSQCAAVALAQDLPLQLEPVTDPERRRVLYGLSILPPSGRWLAASDVQGHRLGLFRDLGQKTIKERHTAAAEVAYRWLQGCTEPADCLRQGIEWMQAGEGDIVTVAFATATAEEIDPHCVRFEAIQENRKAPGFGRQGYSSPAAGLLCTHPEEPTLFITLLYSERFRRGGEPAFLVAEEAARLVASLQFEPLRTRVIGWTHLGPAAGAIAAVDDQVWVQHRQRISRIADDGTILRTVSGGADGVAMAFADGSLWVGHLSERRLSRIDPDRDRVTAQIALPGPVIRVVAAHDAVWARVLGGGVVRVDPTSNTVTGRIDAVPGGGSVAAGPGAIWATSEDQHLYRIDPERNTVAERVRVCSVPLGVTFRAPHAWIACPESGEIVAVDPATDTVSQRIHLGGSPFFLAADAEALWVTHRQHGTVSRVPLDSFVPDPPIALEGGPFDLQVSADIVWVTDRPSGKVFRLQASPGRAAALR